jgi:hypothetical protein
MNEQTAQRRTQQLIRIINAATAELRKLQTRHACLVCGARPIGLPAHHLCNDCAVDYYVDEQDCGCVVERSTGRRAYGSTCGVLNWIEPA